jgi:hypothetical protein
MSGVEMYKTDTYTNQNGAYAISYGEKEVCLVTPYTKVGHVKVTWLSSEKGKKEFALRSENTFEANLSGITCLALNHEGTILAVASE